MVVTVIVIVDIVLGRVIICGWLSLSFEQGSSSMVVSSELVALVLEFFGGGGRSHPESS